MERRSDKNAYTDSVSQGDHYYTRMLLPELFIQAQLHTFLCLHPICKDPNKSTALRIHLSAESFSFLRYSTQNTFRKVLEHIRTFSSLLIIDNRTRMFGHSPVPQAYCTLFNLSRRIPLDLILSWIWVTLKFTTGKGTIFHVYHSNDPSTYLCNFLLCWSQRCEFSMKLLRDPTGRSGIVT